MYSTCLFCNSDLGSNEAVEHFPVGRRLAFDASKGRLWAVCRKCERWNLTPIEERWEAIEECERFFRATRLRVSTDQIGLARIKEGLELVRIGKPLRPEFAAWRYGDQFGRRRRKAYVLGTVALVAGVSMPFIGTALGLSLGAFGANIVPLFNSVNALYQRRRVVGKVYDNDGRPLLIQGYQVQETLMLPPTSREPWGLCITHHAHAESRPSWWVYKGDEDVTEIRGEPAMRAAARLLPLVNRNGASAKQVTKAVELATEYGDPTVPFDKAARFTSKSWYHRGDGAKLTLVPTELRLAMEMASHEDAERRALEGELNLLEDAWREAEEIASISDNMFLPREVSEQLADIKSRAP